MADAAARIGDRIVNDQFVANMLRTTGPVVEMPQYQQDYQLPDDCKEIQRLQLRVANVGYSTLTGAATTSVAATWAAKTDGSFGWMVDDRVVYVYNIVLTGAATMAAVATILQTAFRAASGGTEVIEWDTDHFEMHGYTTTGFLVPAPAPGRGTDLSTTGWMAGRTGQGTISYAVPSWEWSSLVRGNPPDPIEPIISSLSIVFPPQAPGGVLNGVRWCPGQSPGYVHIWPQPLISNLLFRMQYLRKPQMPANDAQGWPYFADGFDELVEYYTAWDMANQELQDPAPLAYLPAAFESKYASYTAGWRRLDMPQRSYIQIVGANGYDDG